MSELKTTIVKNILDKKYNKANIDFEKSLKQKTFDAIDKYKQAFKFVTLDKEEPAKNTPKEKEENVWSFIYTGAKQISTYHES